MKYGIIFFSLFILIGCGPGEEVAVISTQHGDIVIAFFPDTAPKHVESFMLHAREGYFDGTTFHRIIPGFVIQGGDPHSRDKNKMNDGSGGHAARFYGVGTEADTNSWMLPSEFSDLPHTKGALSMARAQDPNSAGSQFFICVADVRRLDNKYTVFGEVIQGLDVVDKIVNSKRDARDNPIGKVTMTVKLVPRKTLAVDQQG